MPVLAPLPAYSNASVELYRVIDLLGAAQAYLGRVSHYEAPLPRSAQYLPNVRTHLEAIREELIHMHQKMPSYSRVDERFGLEDMWPDHLYLGMGTELLKMASCLQDAARYAWRLGTQGPQRLRGRFNKLYGVIRAQYTLLKRLIKTLVAEEQLRLPL